MTTNNNIIAASLLADAALPADLHLAAPASHDGADGNFPSHAMPPLDGDTGADVCIIGASFVGLRTAYDLLNKGKTVVVIECAASPAASNRARGRCPLRPPERSVDGRRHGGAAGARSRRARHLGRNGATKSSAWADASTAPRGRWTSAPNTICRW